jgi:hypothetical protein
VTQDHNTRVTENSVVHIDRGAQSMLLADFSNHSMWMMEFSITLVFRSCVTLGIFNSVQKNSKTTFFGAYVTIQYFIYFIVFTIMRTCTSSVRWVS